MHLIKIIGCIHCCIGWKPAGNKPYKSYENLYNNKRLCNWNRVFLRGLFQLGTDEQHSSAQWSTKEDLFLTLKANCGILAHIWS